MGTIVFQELQSCLESHLTEPTRTLRLKLSSPTSHFSPSIGFKNEEKMVEKRSRSFIDDLLNKKPAQEEEKETSAVYVHCRPSFKFSLEMCTETLGSETGSDISENSIYWPNTYDDKSSSAKARPKKTKHVVSSLPPPLTTRRGTEESCVQMKVHRDNERIVVSAVRVSLSPTCFRADRSNGRLRLFAFEDPSFEYQESELDSEEIPRENKEEIYKSLPTSKRTTLDIVIKDMENEEEVGLNEKTEDRTEMGFEEIRMVNYGSGGGCWCVEEGEHKSSRRLLISES